MFLAAIKKIGTLCRVLIAGMVHAVKSLPDFSLSSACVYKGNTTLVADTTYLYVDGPENVGIKAVKLPDRFFTKDPLVDSESRVVFNYISFARSAEG